MSNVRSVVLSYHAIGRVVLLAKVQVRVMSHHIIFCLSCHVASSAAHSTHITHIDASARFRLSL